MYTFNFLSLPLSVSVKRAVQVLVEDSSTAFHQTRTHCNFNQMILLVVVVLVVVAIVLSVSSYYNFF